MTEIRIHILGPLRVSRGPDDVVHLSKAVRQVIALIAASGHDGLNRNELAAEVWGGEPPGSWPSAIRNRLTSVRKALGAETLIGHHGRFRFTDSVAIDSWELIKHGAAELDVDTSLGYLVGEPLAGLPESPLVKRHISQVADVRALIVQQVIARSDGALSPAQLQSLRFYQRLHPLSPVLAREVVRAHMSAGESARAAKIVEEVAAAATVHGLDAAWLDELRQLTSPSSSNALRQDMAARDWAEVVARAELFETAARDEHWNIALDIATAGLPEAEMASGDPERVKLLERIPLDKIETTRRFGYCLTMARHLVDVGREADAAAWSRTALLHASTPQEESLAHITRAIVGDVSDEREPIPLPPAFTQAADEDVNMMSLQIVVTSHLERDDYADAAPLLPRLNELIHAYGEPSRHWHRLLLESMSRFVEGKFAEAAELSLSARKYADLFSVSDGDDIFFGQLANANWIHDGFELPTGHAVAMGEPDSSLRMALAAASAGAAQAEAFVDTFDIHSRSLATVPRLMVVGGRLADPVVRAKVADRLKFRAGTSSIWESGVLHLGPVDRILARLTEHPTAREAHLRAAVACADRQRTRLWQVVCRLDLASAVPESQHRREAAELANTADLQRLVDEYRWVVG